MSLGYFGRNVEAETETLLAASHLPAEEGLENRPSAAAGIGLPLLVTDISSTPSCVKARSATGLSAAPCVNALPSKLDVSCPRRTGSHSPRASRRRLPHEDVQLLDMQQQRRDGARGTLQRHRDGIYRLDPAGGPAAPPGSGQATDGSGAAAALRRRRVART
jgi:hypothetical protein